jgi:hypothetical protein
MKQKYIIFGLVIVVIIISIIIIILPNNISDADANVKSEVNNAADDVGMTSEMFDNIYENFDTTPALKTRNLKYDRLDKILNNFEDFCQKYFIELDINLINCNLGSGNNCSVSNTTGAINNLTSINSIIKNYKSILTFDYFNEFLKKYLLKLSKENKDIKYDKAFDLCLLGYLTLEKHYLNDQSKYIHNKDFQPGINLLKIAKISKDDILTGSALDKLPLCASIDSENPKIQANNCYYTSDFIKQYINTFLSQEFQVTDSALINELKPNFETETPEEIFTQILIGLRKGNKISQIKSEISSKHIDKKAHNKERLDQIRTRQAQKEADRKKEATKEADKKEREAVNGAITKEAPKAKK